MTKMQLFRIFAALALCVLATGCATSRSEIKLTEPAALATLAQTPGGKTVAIRSVTDLRVFQDAPSDPSVPSLGMEGASASSADIKARAIARKRNGYGQALGDVLLENGHTVESVVRTHLAQAFRQAGYRVVPPGSPANPDHQVDAQIRQFWSWLRPGFWAITVNMSIATDLAISGVAMPLTIRTSTAEPQGAVTDGVWIGVVDRALDRFRADVAEKLPKP